ncbi:DNA polymerase III subunit delta [Vibrio tritonius]|uniref:DNA polymerase III subunit delta n=1 Tax=Vibrio tritonius TaxID=1435069 RepID=A0ABS7YLE7_9VIBR|nr:DNA polymerase III subunit delta [Vibrio tritonius]MCA2016511.1 DNA polymerase III subunit delta [Vibrio tritonius]
MKIFADKLNESLNKGLLPCYFLYGSEPLLLDESKTLIEHAAFQQGFEEKHRFTADASLDWHEVYDCCQSMSLFSARQLIEIDIPESGITAALGKEIAALAKQLNPDIILLILGNKLTKAQENAAWCKEINALGCFVNCLTPDLSRLPQFVMTRCRQLGLTPDKEAVQMLAQWHEGNLFALMQSLEKLRLIYPDGQLTLIRLEEALSRNNHYTAFHWTDALLEGKANRAQRILRQLRAEELEPIILVRTVQKELFQLLKMQQLMATTPLSSVMEKFRIWQNKRSVYAAALQRLTPQKLRHLVQLLAQCEILTKTQYEQPIWPLLQQLSLECCHTEAYIPLPN